MRNDPALRADRLGVALKIFGLVQQPPAEALEETWPLLSGYDIALFRHLDDEDTHLANACLLAEGERRSRQWKALEELLALTPGADAELSDLAKPAAIRVAQLALDLGWFGVAPDAAEQNDGSTDADP